MNMSGHGRERGGPFGRRGRGGFPGGPFPPPGFGFGGPFGRGRRMARGDIRTAILSLLTEEPQHGYHMIQQIKERSEGNWRPSAGSIYPALQQLEDEGLVRAESVGGRRIYSLTEDGQHHTADREEELAAVWDSANSGLDDGMLELRELAGQVAAAIMQVGHAGSADQLARAKDILVSTRKQLYLLLADGDPDPH